MKTLFLLLNLLSLSVTVPISTTQLNYSEKSNVSNEILGVTHNKINATLVNDNNTSSNQNINIFKADSHIELINWTATSQATGAPLQRDIRLIAKDFEAKHPNYEVVAGINGDYFYNHESTNANVTFGAKVLKAQNHTKYLSVVFNKNGNFKELVKSPVPSSDLKAYLYDNTSMSLLKVVDLLNINTTNIKENETGFFYKYSSIVPASGTHYSYEIKEYSNVGNMIHFGLKNGTKKTGVIENTDTKVSILSNDPEVNNLLNLNPIVKIQPKSFINEDEMMIGVGSNVIKDNIIKSFEDIGDQGLDFSKARHPRTGFGFTANNEPVLITVDGRSAGGSQGVNLRELAMIMKSNGVVNGFNLDGGGSTEAMMKINGEFVMVNTPSEGSAASGYRSVLNALFFVKPKNKANIKYELVDDNLTIQINDLKVSSDVYAIIDGVKSKINGNKLTTKIDLTKDISVSVEAQSPQKVMLSNYVIYRSKVKEIPLPEHNISFNTENNNVEFKIEYADYDKIISRIYIIHQQTETRKVALVQNSTSRLANFTDILTDGENTFVVYIEYSNGKNKTETISINNEENIMDKDSNNPNIILISMISLVVLLSIVTPIIIFKVKRK